MLRRKADLPLDALAALAIACSRLGNPVGCREAITLLREKGAPLGPKGYEEAFKVAAARLHFDVINILLAEQLTDGNAPTPTQLSVALSLSVKAEVRNSFHSKQD